MKRCSICKQYKDETEFAFQNKAENKLVSACKECSNKRQRENRQKDLERIRERDRISYQKRKEKRVENSRRYRKNNPGKIMDSNLRIKYGITREQYFEMLEEQGYKCAICGKPRELHSRNFAVDHNHKTGKVRGLLCDGCNYGVGFLEKRKKEYEEYLDKYDG